MSQVFRSSYSLPQGLIEGLVPISVSLLRHEGFVALGGFALEKPSNLVFFIEGLMRC